MVDIFTLRSKDDATITNHDEADVKDLEDFQIKSSSINGPRPIVRCYDVNEKRPAKKTGQLNSAEQQTDTGHELSSLSQHNTSYVENIDRNVDYQGWLELKKRKWKDILDKRKKQRYIIV